MATDDIGDVETGLFVEALYRRYGIDFRGFRRAAIRPRLEAQAARCGVPDISSLQGRVLRDAAACREAVGALGAVSSQFLVDDTCFAALRLAVLPILRSSSWPTLWLADAGGPALPMRVLAMLEEEDLRRKTEVFVTSADEDVLAGLEQVRSLNASWFENVILAQYDLSTDASFKEFAAIICQRPLADFEPELQARALGLFAESLCSFGILQVESPGHMLAAGFGSQFTAVLSEQGIYRRAPSIARARGWQRYG